MNAVPTPPGWLTVPADCGVPSPQSIVGREVGGRRDGVGVGERCDRPGEDWGCEHRHREAAAPRWSLTVGWVAEAVRSASATSASEWATVTLPPSSVTVERDLVGALLGVGVPTGHVKATPLAVPAAVMVGGRQGLDGVPSPQSTHRSARAAGQSEEVGHGRTGVGVGEGGEQLAGERDALDRLDRRALRGQRRRRPR